jgi:hypothetical protein
MIKMVKRVIYAIVVVLCRRVPENNLKEGLLMKQSDPPSRAPYVPSTLIMDLDNFDEANEETEDGACKTLFGEEDNSPVQK